MFIKSTAGVSSHLKLHTYQEGYLLPVLTANDLLFSARHKGLLRQFRDLAELPTEDFDATYGALLNNFMEFVQILPHKTGGILGSLLNYGLARTTAVFVKYCQLRKGQTTPLLKFAVFSAALLKDIGRVMSNQRILLTNPEGDFIAEWNPLSGFMIDQAPCYKMYPISATYLKIEKEVTPLLARQLMPHDTFLWLSNDMAIFTDWLAALLDQEGVGAKEITWIIALIKREDIIAVLSTLEGSPVEQQMPVATALAEEFFKWLKEAIEKGDMEVNTDEAGIHVVNEGVFIEKKIFKQFADLSKMPINFATVFVQFGNAMGIVSKGGGDFFHAQYFSAKVGGYGTFGAKESHATREGMVVNADKIFLKGEAPEKTALKSAQSFVNEQHQRPISSAALAAQIQLNKRSQ